LDIDILYKAVLTGNKNDENALFEVLSVRLNAFAYRKLGDQNDARELVNDVLLAVSKYYRELEVNVSFSAWVYKILKNKIANYWRSKRRGEKAMQVERQRYDNLNWEPDPEFEPHLLACLKQVAQFNKIFARILNLKYQGYNSEEICGRLNITTSNLYVILHRARMALKSCLDEGDIKK
jgi:RNA polymerase sigma-70 factor (ECF subfamily)